MNSAYTLIILLLLIACSPASSETNDSSIFVEESTDGWRLMINGKPFMVNGINWDYYPIGTNYEYVLWDESDEFIKEALGYEMGLLRNMGVNAIRVYTGIPQKWITYIYENFGIYTMLNHSFGRYGLMLDGEWVANTDYSDERVRSILLSEINELALEYKNTSGLLLYLLGNENNYGLFWEGAETEDFPESDSYSEVRARHMYRLFNEGAIAIKEMDSTRPIAIANGDTQFLDIIVEELHDIDIFGTNTYRGFTFRDLYDQVKEAYGKPVLLTEFGADAYNAVKQEEDQRCQASYKHANWMDIYANAAGMGRAGNSIGGFTFQSSDGWWKHGQTTDLDVQNTHASWSNGGYQCDYVQGENNMNEEWFGIMAKGPTKPSGHYDLYPRAAYYVIKEAHKFDPYSPDANIATLTAFFNTISLAEAYQLAKTNQ